MDFEPINQIWPGMQEAIRSGALVHSDVKDAINNLDGISRGNVASQANDFAGLSYSPARIPGTNWHVRIPGLGKGILQLAWTGYKVFNENSDLGDTFTVVSAVEQIKSAVQRLDMQAGETCVYLAIGRAATLLRKPCPSADQITDALRHGGEWCNGNCKLHAGNNANLNVQEVRSVLLTLKSKGQGVVREQTGDQWSVVL